MKIFLVFASLILLISSAHANSLPASRYTITDLGVQPQWNSETIDTKFDGLQSNVILRIGAGGQVAGAVVQCPSGKPPHYLFFRWIQGHLTILGMLSTIAPGPHHLKFYVDGINSRGEAVVTKGVDRYRIAADLTGFHHAHAYFWRKGVLQDLGHIKQSDDTEGQSINEKADIACVCNNDDGPRWAFVWHNGKRISFSLPSYYHALGGLLINNEDEVVGTVSSLVDSETGRNGLVLYHWRSSLIEIVDNPGWPTAIALALNDFGEVLTIAQNNYSGEGYPSITERNYLWTHGQWQPLETRDASTIGNRYGMLLSYVRRENNYGSVVGMFGQYKSLDQRAFIYYSGQRSDLNTLIPANSGWKLMQAFDINDAGEIVGCGTHNGKDSLFLLAPRHSGTQ